ncbi:hypothetical protein C8F04DRAFT_336245 [Mycena alexandri]|uniref:Uncharacterized protein n=1 Tax=Mycena alexandri TaxID=1745969 RepID=A0AAD6WNK1_9AGAR|nr:hypothetical protein C8F04DRAFT_336245 [Mycena alexandri]
MSTIAEDFALPVELEERIFIIAASINPRSIPNMILVARRVQTWLEPHLYKSFILSYRDPSELPPIRVAPDAFVGMANSRPAQQHVRNICITDYMDEIDLERILSAFRGLTRLAIPFFNVDAPLLPFLAQVPLQRLSIKLLPIFGADLGLSPVDFTHPMFAHVTHLDIQELSFEEPPESDQPARWSGWSHLASLSHISFWNYYDRPLFKEILATCPTLQVFIVVVASEQMSDNTVSAECARDPRYIVVVVKDFLDDWEGDATGGEDYWARADHFLEERRCGRIEGKCRVLDFPRLTRES